MYPFHCERVKDLFARRKAKFKSVPSLWRFHSLTQKWKYLPRKRKFTALALSHLLPVGIQIWSVARGGLQIWLIWFRSFALNKWLFKRQNLAEGAHAACVHAYKSVSRAPSARADPLPSLISLRRGRLGGNYMIGRVTCDLSPGDRFIFPLKTLL